MLEYIKQSWVAILVTLPLSGLLGWTAAYLSFQGQVEEVSGRLVALETILKNQIVPSAAKADFNEDEIARLSRAIELLENWRLVVDGKMEERTDTLAVFNQLKTVSTEKTARALISIVREHTTDPLPVVSTPIE